MKTGYKILIVAVVFAICQISFWTFESFKIQNWYGRIAYIASTATFAGLILALIDSFQITSNVKAIKTGQNDILKKIHIASLSDVSSELMLAKKYVEDKKYEIASYILTLINTSIFDIINTFETNNNEQRKYDKYDLERFNLVVQDNIRKLDEILLDPNSGIFIFEIIKDIDNGISLVNKIYSNNKTH